MAKPLTADTANVVTGNITLANLQSLALLGSTTTADLGGTTQNNLSPANLGTIAVVMLTASSAATITGLDSGPIANGRVIYLYALAANAGNITLTNEDAASTAANRFQLPMAAPITLTAGSAVAFRWSSSVSRWNMISSTSSTTLPSIIDTGAFTLSGTITPASLANGLTNNYNPAGLATCATIRQAVNAGATATITGLTAQGTGGRRITLQNLGTGNLDVSHEDTNSTAANRFTLPGGATWEMLPGGAITFLYDGTTSRWLTENMTQCMPFLEVNVTTSPAAITGTQNDYAPVGFAVSGVLRQQLSGNATITGLLAQNSGRLYLIENISTTFTLTLTNEDTGSAAANRFTLPSGDPVVINPSSSVIAIYDTTSARWRLIGQVGAVVPSGTPFLGLFGDGSDGAVHFDGSTVLGFVPASSIYTVTRELNCTTCIIDAGITVVFASQNNEVTHNNAGRSYRLFCNTSLTLNGKIRCAGMTAVGATIGVGAAMNLGAGASAPSQGGTAGVSANGGNGAVAGNHVGESVAAALGGAAGNPGANATGNYGGGGGGGSATTAGGTGGAITKLADTSGNPRDFRALTTTIGVGSGASSVQMIMGGSGGGGGGGSAGNGGAGGGPGGFICVLARSIIMGAAGAFEVPGGAGSVASSGNSGGGGGGGGGTIVLVYATLIGTLTTNLAGGAGGNGVGTGLKGGNGAPGRLFLLSA